MNTSPIRLFSYIIFILIIINSLSDSWASQSIFLHESTSNAFTFFNETTKQYKIPSAIKNSWLHRIYMNRDNNHLVDFYNENACDAFKYVFVDFILKDTTNAIENLPDNTYDISYQSLEEIYHSIDRLPKEKLIDYLDASIKDSLFGINNFIISLANFLSSIKLYETFLLESKFKEFYSINFIKNDMEAILNYYKYTIEKAAGNVPDNDIYFRNAAKSFEKLDNKLGTLGFLENESRKLLEPIGIDVPMKRIEYSETLTKLNKKIDELKNLLEATIDKHAKFVELVNKNKPPNFQYTDVINAINLKETEKSIFNINNDIVELTEVNNKYTQLLQELPNSSQIKKDVIDQLGKIIKKQKDIASKRKVFLENIGRTFSVCTNFLTIGLGIMKICKDLSDIEKNAKEKQDVILYFKNMNSFSMINQDIECMSCNQFVDEIGCQIHCALNYVEKVLFDVTSTSFKQYVSSIGSQGWIDALTNDYLNLAAGAFGLTDDVLWMFGKKSKVIPIIGLLCSIGDEFLKNWSHQGFEKLGAMTIASNIAFQHFEKSILNSNRSLTDKDKLLLHSLAFYSGVNLKKLYYFLPGFNENAGTIGIGLSITADISSDALSVSAYGVPYAVGGALLGSIKYYDNSRGILGKDIAIEIGLLPDYINDYLTPVYSKHSANYIYSKNILLKKHNIDDSNALKLDINNLAKCITVEEIDGGTLFYIRKDDILNSLRRNSEPIKFEDLKWEEKAVLIDVRVLKNDSEEDYFRDILSDTETDISMSYVVYKDIYNTFNNTRLKKTIISSTRRGLYLGPKELDSNHYGFPPGDIRLFLTNADSTQDRRIQFLVYKNYGHGCKGSQEILDIDGYWIEGNDAKTPYKHNKTEFDLSNIDKIVLSKQSYEHAYNWGGNAIPHDNSPNGIKIIVPDKPWMLVLCDGNNLIFLFGKNDQELKYTLWSSLSGKIYGDVPQTMFNFDITNEQTSASLYIGNDQCFINNFMIIVSDFYNSFEVDSKFLYEFHKWFKNVLIERFGEEYEFAYNSTIEEDYRNGFVHKDVKGIGKDIYYALHGKFDEVKNIESLYIKVNNPKETEVIINENNFSNYNNTQYAYFSTNRYSALRDHIIYLQFNNPNQQFSEILNDDNSYADVKLYANLDNIETETIGGDQIVEAIRVEKNKLFFKLQYSGTWRVISILAEQNEPNTFPTPSIQKVVAQYPREIYNLNHYTYKKIISAGYAHSCYLKNDNSVWVWGKGDVIGDKSTNDKVNEVPIIDLPPIYSISTNSNHSLAITMDGNVWMWGNNDYGQLGNGTFENSLFPIKIVGIKDILLGDTGNTHSAVVDKKGVLWCWGNNSLGQLGNGKQSQQVLIPEQIQMDDNPFFINISVGGNHSVALDKNGMVWTWGSNNHGQLGNGTNTNSNNPLKINEISNIKRISAGNEHTIALDSYGKIWIWGNNENGRLGDGTSDKEKNIPIQITELNEIVEIDAGFGHSLALKLDGTVWSWGDNDKGQLGSGDYESKNRPIQVKNLTNIAAISAGHYHNLALDFNGNLYSWGWNNHGQLGDGTKIDKNIPIISNENTNCYVEFLDENYIDGSYHIGKGTKKWLFKTKEKPIPGLKSVCIFQDSGMGINQTEVNIGDINENTEFQINIDIDLSHNSGKSILYSEWKFIDARENDVLITNSRSNTFWMKILTNHAPQFSPLQQTSIGGTINESFGIPILVHDEENDPLVFNVIGEGNIDSEGILNIEFNEVGIYETTIQVSDNIDTTVKKIQFIIHDHQGINDLFTDVPYPGYEDVNSIYSALNHLALHGIVIGESGSEDKRYFNPEKEISQAEALKMLMKSAEYRGFININVTPRTLKNLIKFDEVNNVIYNYSWAENYAIKAEELGMIQNIEFWDPSSKLTRIELAKWITMLFNLEIPIEFISLDLFKAYVLTDRDSFENEESYKLAANANFFGYIEAVDNVFMPYNTINRGEFAQIMSKVLRRPTIKNVLFSDVTEKELRPGYVLPSVIYGKTFKIIGLEGLNCVKLSQYNSLIKEEINCNIKIRVISDGILKETKLLNDLSDDPIILSTNQNEISENQFIQLLFLVEDVDSKVIDIHKEQIFVIKADKDMDGVSDAEDLWPNYWAYNYDDNNNGIPDIEDSLWGIQDKQALDTIMLDDIEMTIIDAILSNKFIDYIIQQLDLNENTNISSVIQVLQTIANVEGGIELSKLDINNDMKVEITDAILMMKKLVNNHNLNLCYSSCKEIFDQYGSIEDGSYFICPNMYNKNELIEVYCDMTTDSGGWTFFNGNIAENSYSSIINACPANTKPFELKSTNHAMALEKYVKNIAEDEWFFANAFTGPNISDTCEDEHNDVEVGYLIDDQSWKNSNIDETTFGISSSNNCNLNIYDPIPINHASGLTNRSGNNYFYNNTEQVEKGIVICSTNDIDAYTELSHAFTITTYPASDFTNDTLAMNNKLGINNYIIEDFEDVNLVEELSIQLGDNPPLTQLSQIYDPSTWGPSAWDGQYVVLNSTDNAFNLPQTTFKSRITFLIKDGTTSFGIGLSNFQRGETQNHPIIINGQKYIENIASLSNYTDYIDQNSAKNMYLRIDGNNGESIESITFGYDGSNVDGLMFDHLAFKKNDLENDVINLDEGLVAYYPFNANANDSSGNGYHGIVNGAILIEDGYKNGSNSYKFDGSNDEIIVNNKPIINKFSYSLWINIKGFSSNHATTIIHRQVNEVDNTECLRFDNPDKILSFYLIMEDGKYRELFGGKYSGRMEEWIYLVATYDGINMKLYDNSELIAVQKFDSLQDLLQVNNPFIIGGERDNGKPIASFKGFIDDLRIYNRTLLKSEIKQLYKEGLYASYQDDYPNTCDDATLIEMNKIINAKIDYQGQNENDGDCDYFQIEIPEEMAVSIFTTGDTDTYGILFNCCNGSPPNCSIRIDDSNNGDNNNFRINEILEKGTYYLKVRHEDITNGTGNYNLHLQKNDVLDLDDGLVAYYPFNGNTNDESGNGNHGIPKNSVMLTTDRFENFNSAYKFDDSNDAIEIQNPIGLPSLNEATLSFWASHRSKYSNENYSTMYSESNLGEDTNSYFCVQYSNSTEKLDLHSSFFDDERIFIETSFIIPFDSSWHHYLITKKGNIYNIFVDGNKVGSGEQEFPKGSKVTYIGERTPSTNYQPIIGKMDDIRIYNRALSVSEIKLLYSMNQQNIQDDYPNTCDNALPIELNQTINANIDYPGLNESDGDCDYFKIDISDEKAVSIYTTGDTDTYGILFNCCNGSPPNCSIRIDDSNNGDNNNFRINEILEKGTYYLKVRHEDKINGTGNYNLLYVLNNILQEHEIYTYNAEKIPSEDSWVIVNYNDYESKGATIENGFLHIKDSDQYFGSAIHYLKEWDVETNCNNIAEFNVKIVSNSGNSGIVIGTSNGSHNMTYDLLTNRVISYYKNANGIRTTGKIIDINTTDFNTYKLSIIKGVAKLFINNNLVIEQTAGTGNYNGNGVEFGAGCSSATGEAYFKEIRLYKQCNE